MVGRVPLALIAALTTRHDARFDRGADDAEIDFVMPCHDAANRIADACAVEIQPDGPDQVQRVRLAEARIGAGGARGGTVEALVDAPQEQVAIEVGGPRMPLDDVSDRHVLAPSRRDWVVVKRVPRPYEAAPRRRAGAESRPG